MIAHFDREAPAGLHDPDSAWWGGLDELASGVVSRARLFAEQTRPRGKACPRRLTMDDVLAALEAKTRADAKAKAKAEVTPAVAAGLAVRRYRAAWRRIKTIGDER